MTLRNIIDETINALEVFFTTIEYMMLKLNEKVL